MEAYEAQRLVCVIGNAIGGLIEAMGMQATNQERLSKGHTIAYDDKAFYELMEERGLHHDALIVNTGG